jgi:hypothetical protein
VRPSQGPAGVLADSWLAVALAIDADDFDEYNGGPTAKEWPPFMSPYLPDISMYFDGSAIL